MTIYPGYPGYPGYSGYPGGGAHHGQVADSHLRVTEAERDRAVAMLQEAFADGRIDHAELDHRIGAALGARERSELSAALRGLPAGARLVTQPVTRPASLERSWAFAAHWIGFLTLFVGPMVIAMTKGGGSRYVREQAWEAANYHLTFLAACIALGLLTAVTLGLAGVLFAPLGLVWSVLTLVGGLAAAAGNGFRYPWSLRIFG